MHQAGRQDAAVRRWKIRVADGRWQSPAPFAMYVCTSVGTRMRPPNNSPPLTCRRRHTAAPASFDCMFLLLLLYTTLAGSAVPRAQAAISNATATYQVRFLKANSSGAPVPFISSVNPNADVFAKFGAGPMFPSIVEVGSSATHSAKLAKADPSANFYLYYAAHRGRCIKMAWSQYLEGPWYEYNNPSFAYGCGVMPLPERRRRGRGRRGRLGWDHVSAPHVLLNSKHRRFIMFFHGRHGGNGGHNSFIASSSDGLNFSGMYDIANSSLMQGQGTATWRIDNGRHRPLVIGTNYSRPFSHDADGDGKPEFYVIGKRGRVCRLPHHFLSSGLQHVSNPINSSSTTQLTKCDEMPENLYEMVDGQENGHEYIYKSPLTEFLGSKEFANHPNNPHRGCIIHSVSNARNESFAYANHVGIYKPSYASELEVFFYIKLPWVGREREAHPPQYQGLYRVVYDLRDHRSDMQKRNGVEAFEVWRLMRDSEDGNVIFEEIISTAEMGIGPAGDSFVHTFSNGKKSIFFSTGPEGSIYGAELVTT